MGTAQALHGPTGLDRMGTAQLAFVVFKQFWTQALYSNCAGQPMSNTRWPMPNPHYIDHIDGIFLALELWYLRVNPHLNNIGTVQE